MDKIDHVLELAKSSHQYLPALLSLLVGLLSIKREPFLNIEEKDSGDNIPVTLMESIRRRYR